MDEGEGSSNDSRYADSQLDTLLGPDALAKKLLKIARDARTAEEEQGVNILYLALGFVTWFEVEKSSLPDQSKQALALISLKPCPVQTPLVSGPNAVAMTRTVWSITSSIAARTRRRLASSKIA